MTDQSQTDGSPLEPSSVSAVDDTGPVDAAGEERNPNVERDELERGHRRRVEHVDVGDNGEGAGGRAVRAPEIAARDEAADAVRPDLARSGRGPRHRRDGE